jgi:hypothetical protein
VLSITATVLGIALYTRNKRAVKMFVFAMGIWALIEGIGLVTGMRAYNPPEERILVFLFVAFVEDPGWVCLGFMMAEQLFKRLKPRTTGTIASVEKNPSGFDFPGYIEEKK